MTVPASLLCLLNLYTVCYKLMQVSIEALKGDSMRKRIFFLTFFLATLLWTSALADPAKELTSSCRFKSNGPMKDYSILMDGDLRTYFPLKKNTGKKQGELIISSETPMSGVEIKVFDMFGRAFAYDLQVRDGDTWRTVDQGGKYLTHWHVLPEPVQELRILVTGKEHLRLAGLRVFASGDPPPEIQRWDTLEKCDLMLLTAHPDDEILWFAGLMPTYAGERKLRLQLAVLVPTGGQRKQELLAAVWHCGVTHYPEFLGFVDKNSRTLEKQYRVWRGKSRVISRVVEAIRKHQPEVLITHGENGEYGHGAHKAAANAAKNAVKLAGRAKRYPASVKKYGVWEVKKLYLHEYKKNPIVCDWNQSLSAFGGKTGYEVAQEAFLFHGSQVRRNWSFKVHGAHDNAHFGLYYSSVGMDSGIGDLMEHIDSVPETK